MNFEKVHKEFLKGKKIRRREWEHFMHMRLIDGSVITYKGEYTQYYNDGNILVSTGWIIIDEEDKELTFIQALDELKLKKKITRKDWKENGIDQFLFIDNNEFVMCKAIQFSFMPTYKCFMANDWEIMA